MAGFIGVLLLVGFVGAYWPQVLAALVVVWLIQAAIDGYGEAQAAQAAERASQAATAARADRQHASCAGW